MSSEMLMAAKLALYVRSLVMMAASKTDPQSGADLVYDKLPDEWIDLLELPIWWTALCEKAPAVKPYEEWFTAVRNLALGMFNEPDADGDEIDPAKASGTPQAT